MSLDNVTEKVKRARHHFEELHSELVRFYGSLPGTFVEVAAANGNVRLKYVSDGGIPEHFGLIAGDCLQCLRSSLDYLVWELVLANNKEPASCNQFPVSLVEKDFDHAVTKRNRLKGVHPDAAEEIRLFQPFLFDEPHRHPIALLESLSNINKHRRPLFTDITGNYARPPFSFPHVSGHFHRFDADRRPVGIIPVWAYASFQDGGIKGFEITATLDLLAKAILEDTIPKFKRFFT